MANCVACGAEIDCPPLTKVLISSPNGSVRHGVNTLPSKEKVLIRTIAQGPKPKNFDPDMPANCQKNDLQLTWDIRDGKNRPITPTKETPRVKGTWGRWYINTPTSADFPVSAVAHVKQLSTGVTIIVGKTWGAR